MTNENNQTSGNEFDQEAATWDEQAYRHERARVIAKGIQNYVALTPQMTALEYGCGTALLSFALQPHLGQITLADSSSGMLAVVAEKIAAAGTQNMAPLLVDLVTDPLPMVKVQLVYTLMTLHHIPETGKVLKAFYDLLEEPGYACIADLDQEDGSFHGPDFTGHKGFDREALGSVAREVGFANIRFTTIYQTPRPVGNSIRHFPLFLLVAEKQRMKP